MPDALSAEEQAQHLNEYANQVIVLANDDGDGSVVEDGFEFRAEGDDLDLFVDGEAFTLEGRGGGVINDGVIIENSPDIAEHI